MENGGGLSVDLEEEIIKAEVDVVTHVTSPRWIASVRLKAGDLRNIQLKVGFSPIAPSAEEAGNPYHGEAWGTISRGQRKNLLRTSEWLVPVPGCSLSPD